MQATKEFTETYTELSKRFEIETPDRVISFHSVKNLTAWFKIFDSIELPFKNQDRVLKIDKNGDWDIIKLQQSYTEQLY